MIQSFSDQLAADYRCVDAMCLLEGDACFLDASPGYAVHWVPVPRLHVRNCDTGIKTVNWEGKVWRRGAT